MDLTKILAVTGKPGLYKLQKEHGNKLIIKSLIDGRNTFVPISKGGFSVLETVEVYTSGEEGSMSLPAVFREMFKMDEAGTSTPDAKKGADDDLRDYFTKVVPDHDTDKVYVSHIKKIVKWYDLLKKNDLVDLVIPEPEEEVEEGAEEKTED